MKKDLEQSWVEMQAQLQTGHFQKALKICLELQDRFPEQAALWHQSALIYHQLGQPDKALNGLQGAVDRAPTFPGYLYALGQALSHEKQWAKAREIWEQLLHLEPASIPAHQHLSETLIHLNERKMAAQHQEIARQLAEKNLQEDLGRSQGILHPEDFSGYRYHFDYFSVLIPALKQNIMALAKQPELQILEIGSYEGLSSLWFLNNLLINSGSTLTCIDPWMPYADLDPAEQFLMTHIVEANFDWNMKKALRNSPAQLNKLKGRSEDLLPTLKANSFDLILVDGSHRACDVLSDMVLSWPLLKTGGIMICDDYQWERYPEAHWKPKTAIDAFLSCYAPFCEIMEKGWAVIFQKKANIAQHPTEG